MSLPQTFLASLEILTPRQIFEAVDALGAKRSGSIIQVEHELKPADLFCYLEARFGPPNGIQNLLRSDDSDNLIHWDWTLRHPDGIISFLGMNFRTEIQVLGRTVTEEDGISLIEQIKSDFKAYGPAMKSARDGLERWTEFVNPYQRLRGAVARLVSLLDELKLDPEKDKLDRPGESEDPQPVMDRWNDLARRYSQGFGLCFGIRSMLPVMAEAFVNLLLYVLMRPELRQDARLSENVFRQHIDIRIKSLAINCLGFTQAPDYSNEACKAYHRLVNERNDLLHGNIAIDKLKFNEVYFRGRVPVFKEYKSMWERSLQRQADAVGLTAVRSELATVDALVTYLLSCLDEGLREKVAFITGRHNLGLNEETGFVGVLFADWLVDFRTGGQKSTKDEAAG